MGKEGYESHSDLDKLSIEEKYDRKCQHKNEKNRKTEYGRIPFYDFFFEISYLLRKYDSISICL